MSDYIMSDNKQNQRTCTYDPWAKGLTYQAPCRAAQLWFKWHVANLL